jgi:RecJ-like exonuclease
MDTHDDSRPAVYDLPPDADRSALDVGRHYHATVNGVVEYGVFVDISDALSGLVHASNLDDEHAVGDDLVVTLDVIRDDGDLAFVPTEVEEYRTVSPEGDEDDRATVEELSDRHGDVVHLAGEAIQINQTGGPTIFTLRDETGAIPCAAFESAGVRAYPDIEVGDVVTIDGTVQQHDGSLQIEAESIDRLSGEDAATVRDRLANARDRQAEPHEIDPLVDWPGLAKHLPELETVARLIREAVIEGRPIRMRYHADGDGMCAALPLEAAIERCFDEFHTDPEAAQHLLRRSPSRAPYYELEDMIRDLSFSLGDGERYGQKLPLVILLDNGSTTEDVPAYRTLDAYDIPVVAIDHHHPDTEAVEEYLAAHVNPYCQGEDYAITTGMLCVELARMITPDLTDELEHVPAVAGLADRSEAPAMGDYLDLAADAGYEKAVLDAIGDALDYAGHWLKYDAGESLLNDILGVDHDDERRHREAVAFFAEGAEDAIEEQLDATLQHLDTETLASGVDCYQIDLDAHAHRFTYPAPGTTTGAIHDRQVEQHGRPAITIGYGSDFAVLRSDGVRLDIPEIIAELQAEHEAAGISGGGHLVVGSLSFLPGKREAVLDALLEKLGEAPIDESVGSTTAAPATE